MVVQINSAQNNANTYFSELLNHLNKYEGESHYFNALNEKFIHFIQNVFLVCNIDESAAIYKNLLHDKAFNNHPFLPFMIRILHKSPISAKLRSKTHEALTNHPQYPLSIFIGYALRLTTKAAKLPLEFKETAKTIDPLIVYLNKIYAPQLLKDKSETLIELSNDGFTFSTLALVEFEIAKQNYDLALRKLALAATQSNVSVNMFLSTQYNKIAQTLTFTHPFALVLATKSIELKDYTLLHDLIAYYENSTKQDEALLLYYLAIGAHNNDEMALKKLSAFYKNNAAVTRFLDSKN